METKRNFDAVIDGLKDLIRDRESFIVDNDPIGSDIFIWDKEVLEKAVELLNLASSDPEWMEKLESEFDWGDFNPREEEDDAESDWMDEDLWDSDWDDYDPAEEEDDD